MGERVDLWKEGSYKEGIYSRVLRFFFLFKVIVGLELCEESIGLVVLIVGFYGISLVFMLKYELVYFMEL